MCKDHGDYVFWRTTRRPIGLCQLVPDGIAWRRCEETTRKGGARVGLAIVLALCSGATWAIGMTVAKPALRHIDILSYMLGRWLIVVPLALIYGFATGTFAFASWIGVGFAALAGFIDSTLGGLFYMLAMQRTPAYQTSTLASTAPLWGVVSAILILHEPLRWSVIVAALLVVLGAFLLVGHRMKLRGHLAGSALGLLTGLLWGFAETIPSKLALQHGLSPASLLFVFSCSGVLTIAAMIPLLRSRFPRRIERRGVAYMVLAAAGGAFLGWIFWLSSLERAPASLISPIRGSTLLFAFLYTLVFLRERPAARAFVGVLCVLAAVVLVSVAS
ncbi:DMT family transporter [Candidatus Bipolaricaulota bacterium]